MANNQASDLIETALNEAIKSTEDYAEGDILVEWILVAFTANPDEEKGSGYPMFLSNGEMPTYRALGLLSTALRVYGTNVGEES